MIRIDYRDGRPIYEQVVDGFEQLILRGVLPADSQLPSVRQMAMELSVNPNTIQRAYTELENRGAIYSARGRGNFVASNIQALRGGRLQQIGEQLGELAGEARHLGATEEQIQAFTAKREEEKA